MLTYAAAWFGMVLVRLLSSQQAQAVYVLLLGFLIVFSGLRWEVGCDWINYFGHYYNVSDPEFSPWDMPIEQGWWLLIDTVESLGFPYYALNLIVAILFFVSIHRLARLQNDRVTFLIVLFPMLILGIVMAAVRQAVAIGFVSIALIAFINRAPLRMTLWIAVASTFHVSALVFAPLIPLSWGKLSKLRIVFGIMLSVPIAFLIVSSENADRANDVYFGTEIVARGAIIRLGSLLSTALLFWFFLRKSWRTHSPQDYPLAMILFFGTLALLAIVGPASVVADRLSYYLVPMQAMVVSRAYSLPNIWNRKFLLTVQWLVLTIALFGWMSQSRHFAECYVPYQNVIFGYR